MPQPGPNFSPYPFERVRRVSKRDAAIESVLARWIAVRPLGPRLAKLAGGAVGVTIVGIRGEQVVFDPHAALAEVRIRGLPFVLSGASRPVRALAQRLLGGPAELPAPRPLAIAEHAVFALALAAAIEDMGIAAEVWPIVEPRRTEGVIVELAVDLAGTPMTIMVACPRDLEVRVPPARALPPWSFDLPIVVGACALPRALPRRLAVRDVITIERQLALRVGEGQIALAASPGAVEAEVLTGYVPRDMALPDEAHLELTVQLGTTRLSLRQLAELVPGQIVPLGRPLSGPFEVRAEGRLLGAGELVDVDGELGVRIVSVQE